MSAYLELQNLSKVFGCEQNPGPDAPYKNLSKKELLETTGQVIGVRNVNISINSGELFVVMGLSGSGKSTLVRMINRLIEPTEGRVVLNGVDITAMSKRELVELRRNKMSMVFQSFALLPHLSVLENVIFGLRVAGVDKTEARERGIQALKLVSIAEVKDQKPEQLSGGMQQRVGLARAWVTEPEVMLMDEAFSALDPLIRNDMQDALLELQSSDKRTIVFISHDLREAVKIADRIAIMSDGEVRQVGTPTDIVKNPADEYVRAFFEDIQPGQLLTAGDIAIPGETGQVSKQVAANTQLEELLPIAAASDSPIAVADNSGKVIGVIDRARLLESLARG